MDASDGAAHGELGQPSVLPWRRRPPRRVAGFLSPRVRRIATRRRVDTDRIVGSGADGRVTATDVLAAPAGAEKVAFNRIRSRAAPRLVASKRVSAHAWTAVECDYSSVEAVRAGHRRSWRAREGFSLTYLPFVARAVIDACTEFPEVNATFGTADSPTAHRDVNLGIAVDLDHEGLVVPVIPSAQTLRVVGIARAVVDLAERARARRLVPDDLSGGTFTITNPGAHGTYLSVPILNQPQVAILSTDGVAKRVRATADAHGADAIVVKPVGFLCMSYDRRAVDDAHAGRFLCRVKEILEDRDWRVEV